MTDQTTARDRAAVERALKLQAGSVLAREVLRLRALAGAPTADVAGEALEILGDEDGRIDLSELAAELSDLRMEVSMLRTENRRLHIGAATADVAAEPVASNVRGAADWLLYYYAEPQHQGEEDQTGAAYWALGDDLAEKLIDAFRELARLRAAAPVVEHEACLNAGCVAPRGHTDDHESAGGDTWENSIDDPGDDAQGEMTNEETYEFPNELSRRSAEIVDSGRCLCTDWDACVEHEALEVQGEADDEQPTPGDDAQGEMAAELTAAHAAIQRVRALAERLEYTPYAGSIRRALDGDTTEEA